MEDKTFEARRMASAGKLAAYAAHEIRNPLTAIKGLLHLAQESMSGAAAGSVRSCEGAIDEMEHTMTQILSFAKHGTPKVAFVRLSEILPIPAAGDGDCIDMPMVLADKEILRRGLKAIADSAVGATPGGRGVRISASADEDAGYASIVLDIPGVEVPKHRPSEVFDPSFEVHGAHIGFGLSVGRRLLEESGATVEVVAGGEALRLRVRLRLAREFPAATSTGGDPPK
jgi:signal transduction histidine kinase